MQDVAVLDDVIGALQAQAAGFPGALLAAMGDKILVRDRLGANEAPREIAVDPAGRLPRRGAAFDGPGARLLRADREKGDEVEEPIAGPDDAGKPAFGQPERPRNSRFSAASASHATSASSAAEMTTAGAPCAAAQRATRRLCALPAAALASSTLAI